MRFDEQSILRDFDLFLDSLAQRPKGLPLTNGARLKSADLVAINEQLFRPSKGVDAKSKQAAFPLLELF